MMLAPLGFVHVPDEVKVCISTAPWTFRRLLVASKLRFRISWVVR